MKKIKQIRPNRTTSTNRGTGNAPPSPAKLALVLLSGALTASALSAQSPELLDLLFGHDYNRENFGDSSEDVISATTPGGGAQTGAFRLEKVARIGSVSIALSHSYRADLSFSLIAPDGNVFSFMDYRDYSVGTTNASRDFGDGGSDLDGLATYTFTESIGDPISDSGGDHDDSGAGPASRDVSGLNHRPNNSAIPGGAYRARSWQSAPTGGWGPGVWTLFLRDEDGGADGAVGRIEVRGALVPEPSAFALLAGLGALAGVALRRRPVARS